MLFTTVYHDILVVIIDNVTFQELLFKQP